MSLERTRIIINKTTTTTQQQQQQQQQNYMVPVHIQCDSNLSVVNFQDFV